eukprot:scaffold3410_cov141-Cylindrotheca_fusiformis.AAC.11
MTARQKLINLHYPRTGAQWIFVPTQWSSLQTTIGTRAYQKEKLVFGTNVSFFFCNVILLHINNTKEKLGVGTNVNSFFFNVIGAQDKSPIRLVFLLANEPPVPQFTGRGNQHHNSPQEATCFADTQGDDSHEYEAIKLSVFTVLVNFVVRDLMDLGPFVDLMVGDLVGLGPLVDLLGRS